MEKIKFNIEYQLNSVSASLLWSFIGNNNGLAEWFSDEVQVSDNEYVFSWDKNQQKARLLNIKHNEYIQFQWEEDIDTTYYFEMKMVLLKLTGDMMLLVTDFAEPSEVEDLKMLWNKQIELLKRKIGV